MKYVVYMEMNHITVDGTHLLAKIRVGEAADLSTASDLKFAAGRMQIGSPACNAKNAIYAMNPNAGSVKIDFHIAGEF